MRVMTIAPSPYLFTKNSRINSEILRKLKKEGHSVLSVSWHHDEGYFLPDKDSVHYYEYNNEKICKIVPFINCAENSAPKIYEIMKSFQPEVVITIGDYKETDFVYSIKAMLPGFFRWIGIVSLDCLWLNENHAEFLEYADFIVTTNKFGFVNICNKCNVPARFIPFGPDLSVFKSENKKINDKMKIIKNAKNAQSSNIGAFIKACGDIKNILDMSEDGIEAYLHTNMFDLGDYDIKNLINRYESFNVKTPDMYVSINDGPSNQEMANIYKNCDFYVDCSVKSSTGLSMLEAMACGAIPIGMETGRVGEIISEMPKEFQFFVQYETYIGKCEEEYSVISTRDLVETLIDVKQNLFDDKQKLIEASQSAIAVAGKYSNTDFSECFYEVFLDISNKPVELAVDSFKT